MPETFGAILYKNDACKKQHSNSEKHEMSGSPVQKFGIVQQFVHATNLFFLCRQFGMPQNSYTGLIKHLLPNF